MKYLLISLGSIGDVMPFLAVADALRQRGHEAVIGSQSGYAQLVRGSGFEFAILSERTGPALDGVIASDPDKAWRMAREAFGAAAGPIGDFIADHARRGPCRVIASWNAQGVAKAEKEFGIPLFRVYLSPGALAETGEEAGERLGFFPAWFAPEIVDIPLTGFAMADDAVVPQLPAELQDFLGRGSKPLIFTPGSFMRRSAAFFRESLAVCEALGLRGLFLTPYGDQVPALPADIRHFPFISLQRLAPFGAALVHHGGIGTCAQGLRAGIPQLIAPVFFDQPDNAARIEALGVGRTIRAYRAAEAGETLRDLLTSAQVRDQCASVRAHFASADPLRRICERVGAG